MDDKIIVTNKSALKNKYGAAGVTAIKNACVALIAKDKDRGLATRVIYVDDAAEMKKLGGSAVTNAINPKQNKEAIDAIFKKLGPDYLLILGSIDVVPHQDLKNPVPADGDKSAFGDLPYACEAPYSKKPEDFVGPTRVVGRLPDLFGADKPDYLLDLLKTATNAKPSPAPNYSGYFAISADVWKGSTQMSLDNLFGSSTDMHLSPKKGPSWAAGDLKNRLHFINCHGAMASPQFFGQKGNSYPVAYDAADIAKKIVEGTVASVECCFGAELYDSTLADGQMGIGNTYLAEKAYGFFGSTTIAYGPPNDNGAADLICQYFLKHVLAGASIGRAALQARQDFVESTPYLDPMDLKTLAQFYLLGDPSIVPIESSAASSVNVPKTKAKGMAKAGSFYPGAVERSERRTHLHTKGLWLAKNQPVCSSTGRKPSKPAVAKTMREIAKKIKLSSPRMLSFSIKNNPVPKIPGAKSMAATAFHVVMPDNPAPSGKDKNINASVCAVAKEVNGKVVSYRELHLK